MQNKIILILILIGAVFLLSLAACAPAVVPTPTPRITRPSNPGGPGAAVGLKGDVHAGKAVYAAQCIMCHWDKGLGGVPNSGAPGGVTPALNPIDPTLFSSDYTTFATNLDLFIEHGSTPVGNAPEFIMPAFGDTGKLTPQQIADVIAYVISLNK
jgi:mono/diheme cytochrome c family protein